MASLHDGNRTLLLRLPPFPAYDIARRVRVVFTVPAACVRTFRRPFGDLEFEIDHGARQRDG